MAVVVFNDRLSVLRQGTEAAIERAAEIIGGMIESNAKAEVTAKVYDAPETWYVRTGNLRNGIGYKVENKDTVIAGASAYYAPFVELGTGVHASDGQGRKTGWSYQDSGGNWHWTSGMRPRPFIRPAFEQHTDEYKDVLIQELKKIT